MVDRAAGGAIGSETVTAASALPAMNTTDLPDALQDVTVIGDGNITVVARRDVHINNLQLTPGAGGRSTSRSPGRLPGKSANRVAAVVAVMLAVTTSSFLPPGPQGWPAGKTALCRDGWYSQSHHRSGTCSSHGGVAEWRFPADHPFWRG